MNRSLTSAIAGLRSQQTKLDVIGNNIANVNTTAFKAARVTFADAFSQTIQAATRPSQGFGGQNAQQIGLGTVIGSVNNRMTQGGFEATGIATDLAIAGDSFFVVRRGEESLYTRAGNFEIDGDGTLVSPSNGARLQGRQAVNGVLQPTIGDLSIPVGLQVPARATANVNLFGNLDSSAAVGTVAKTSATIFDSLGNPHSLRVEFEKVGANTWNYRVYVDGQGLNPPTAPATPGTLIAPGVTPADYGQLQFSATGALQATAINDETTYVAGPPASWTMPAPAAVPAGAPSTALLEIPALGGANPINPVITFASGTGAGALAQFGGSSSAQLSDQDGYIAGELDSFSVDRAGIITGAFSNGETQTLGQLLLADFINPAGLEKDGDNMYRATANSGSPVLGYAGASASSTIQAAALETSNVDLAQEFTSMIVGQRAFQANSKTITTADEMLQDLVNLIR